jgi:hypothetical protein
MEEHWRRLFQWDVRSPKLIVDLAGTTAAEGGLDFVALQGALELGKDLILYAGGRHCCWMLGMGGSVDGRCQEFSMGWILVPKGGLEWVFGGCSDSKTAKTAKQQLSHEVEGFIYIFQV